MLKNNNVGITPTKIMQILKFKKHFFAGESNILLR